MRDVGARNDSPQPSNAAITSGAPRGEHNLIFEGGQRIGLGFVLAAPHQVIESAKEIRSECYDDVVRGLDTGLRHPAQGLDLPHSDRGNVKGTSQERLGRIDVVQHEFVSIGNLKLLFERPERLWGCSVETDQLWRLGSIFLSDHRFPPFDSVCTPPAGLDRSVHIVSSGHESHLVSPHAVVIAAAAEA